MKTIAMMEGYYLPHIGGIERYSDNLAKQLTKMGYRVLIVTTQHEKNLPQQEETAYATIYRLPIYGLFSSRYPIIKKNKEYKQILEKLEQEKIDFILLHTRFQLTTLFGAKFAKLHKIPCCVLEHGSSHFTVYHQVLDFFGHIYEHLLTNRIKSLVSDFYGVSKACNEWLKHYHIQAKGVFYNAIAQEEYETYKIPEDKRLSKEKQDTIKILYVGRLLKDKGILLLLEAYHHLKEKYPNIELYLAGDGPLQETLEQEKDIGLLGRLDHAEVMQWYQKADILVNPSYSEGLPTVLLEAGLMKSCILATPVGGTKEIIEDGKNGLFCDTTVESVEEKLETLLLQPDLREKMAQEIHHTIKEKFSWEATAKEVVAQIFKDRK